MRGTLFINPCLIKIHLDPLKAARGRGRGSSWHQCAAIDCASHYQYMIPSRAGGEERVFLLPSHSSGKILGGVQARQTFVCGAVNKKKRRKGTENSGEASLGQVGV